MSPYPEDGSAEFDINLVLMGGEELSSSVYYEPNDDEWSEIGWWATGFNGDALPGLPPCATDDFGEEKQVGGCAPTAIAITQDGTQAFINDDDEDAGITLNIASDGTLEYLVVGDGLSYQGIAVNAAGNAVYSGSTAYSLVDDAMTQAFDGDFGNATEIVDVGGVERLITTLNNSSIAIFDLTTPLAPTSIASAQPTSGAVYQAHSADLSTFVAMGRSSITTLSFDGTAFNELQTADNPPDVTPCDDTVECDYSTSNRGVAMTADGTWAVVGTFVVPEDDTTLAALPFQGRLESWSVAPTTGALTLVDALTFDGASRPVVMVPTPQ